MKTHKTSSASKLIARFDTELKKIIMNELKNLKRAKVIFLNTMGPEHFTAA
jgi:hypothetical protein